jgi:hypothetical protein
VARRLSVRLSLDDYVTRYSSEALEQGDARRRWNHTAVLALALGATVGL